MITPTLPDRSSAILSFEYPILRLRSIGMGRYVGMTIVDHDAVVVKLLGARVGLPFIFFVRDAMILCSYESHNSREIIRGDFIVVARETHALVLWIVIFEVGFLVDIDRFLRFFVAFYILADECDELLAVISLVFMVESDSVAKLMHHCLYS